MRAFKRIKIIAQEAKEIIDNFESNQVIVADIGADHGYISEQVARISKVKKVFATDISQKCLDKVQKLKQECSYKNIETKLGDGLNAIEKADLCIIAGIGGYEIINMLKNQNLGQNGVKCKLFILQPSQDVLKLKKWLYKNSEIKKDYMFECAKRFYTLMVVSFEVETKQNLTSFAKYFGRDTDITGVDFRNFLCYIKEHLKFIENLTNEQIYQRKCEDNFKLYQLTNQFMNKIGGKDVRENN